MKPSIGVDMDKTDINTFYKIGKVDAVCEILMMVRNMGIVPAIRELANQVIKYDSSQCHAKWILENIKD